MTPTTIRAGEAALLSWSAAPECGTPYLNGVQVRASDTAYTTPVAGTYEYTLSTTKAVLGDVYVTVLPRTTLVPTTLTQTIRREQPTGYRRLARLPGEAVRALKTLPNSQTPDPDHVRQLLAFAHLTDLHIVDDQSPMRVAYLDHMADYDAAGNNHGWPTNSAYFPHEVLTSQLADAMARAIRSVGPAPATKLPLKFTILSGDGIDNAQYNETRAYINVLDGLVVQPNSNPKGLDDGLGVMSGSLPPAQYYWHAESSIDKGGYDVGGEYKRAGFPTMPGLYAAARKPFFATGLGMPWYACMGNHDVAVQGNIPLDYLDRWYNPLPVDSLTEIAEGSTRVIDVHGLETDYHDEGAFTVLGDIITGSFSVDGGYVTPNPDRRLVSRSDFVAEHFSTVANQLAGHGFVQGSDKGYYSFSTGPDSLFQFIGLDSNNTTNGINPDGWIDNDQFTWLESQLKAQSSRYHDANGNLVVQSGVKDRLVVLYSHHPLDSMKNVTYQCMPIPGGCKPGPMGHTDAEVKQLLLRFPNVVLMLVGHIHTNRITSHSAQYPDGTNGFWQVATAALSDWPNQSRIVELGIRPDGANGTLSIFTTMLDADAPVQGARPIADVPSNQQPPIDGTPMNLASLARELAANDPQELGAGIDLKGGSPGDRNTELQLPAPFKIPSLCGDGQVCSFPPLETFDEISAPAWPNGWNALASAGTSWTVRSDGSSNMAQVDDPPFISDKWFESPPFVIAETQRIMFTQTVNLEGSYDGAVLEISIENGSYVDITTAGGHFVTGGYNAVISTGFGSPIAGRHAWSGVSSPRQSVQIDVPTGAIGKRVRLRWRVATDSSVGLSGYSFDDVNVVVGAGPGCTPNPNPCPSDQCAGSAPDGCGGQVACHADCSIGGVCYCRSGTCVSNTCSCPTNNCQ